MNCNTKAERIVLERIVALLLALARLVEVAACFPAILRLPVLALLGHGEAVARSFVMCIVQGAAFPAPSHGGARRLASSFRTLARMLGAMLARAMQVIAGRIAGPSRNRAASGARPAPCRPAAPAPDTS